MCRLVVVCYILIEPEEEEEEDDDADDMYASLAVGGAVGGPSAPSWTDVPPPSLLGKDGEPSTTSPRVSPRKTPVTSPTKSSAKSSPVNSPSKVRKMGVQGCGGFCQKRGGHILKKITLFPYFRVPTVVA